MQENRPYASIFASNPSVAAAVKAQFRYREISEAKDRLKQIKNSFRTSKQLAGHADSEDAIVLWVKGYDVTAEEKTNGYLGNYAKISIKPIEDKKVLYARHRKNRIRRQAPSAAQARSADAS